MLGAITAYATQSQIRFHFIVLAEEKWGFMQLMWHLMLYL